MGQFHASSCCTPSPPMTAPLPNTYTCQDTSVPTPLTLHVILYVDKTAVSVHVYALHTRTNRIPRPHPDTTPASLPSPSHPVVSHSTHMQTQTIVHASQSPQQRDSGEQHRVLRQPHKQTKDYHLGLFEALYFKHTVPSRKSETKSVIMPLLLVNMSFGLFRNKLEKLKLLCFTDTACQTMSSTNLQLKPVVCTPKANSGPC